MYPEPTVGAIILNQKDELLLVKSYKWNDKYVIPGGHIEPGEDIEDSLRREIREETNLRIYDIQLVGVQQCIYPDGFHEKKHFIFLDFTCRTNSIEIILNDEHQEYVWVRLDETDTLSIESFTKKLLSEYKTGTRSKYLKSILYNYY